MNKFWKKLKKQYPFLIKWEERARVFTLPGFDGVPIVDVYKFFIAEINSNSLGNRSKSIAYSFFLAIFPALTFVFTLIPYLPYFRDMDVNILKLLRQVMPNQETYKFIKSFIEPLLKDLAKHKRGGLLTGSLLLVFFLTSNGVLAMMSSFDKSHSHYHKRNPIQSRIVALKITVLLLMLFIFSIALIVLGESILSFTLAQLNIHSELTHLLFDVLRYVAIILMFFFSLSLIYYYGPNTKKKYKFISTGATVATVLSILISVAFSYYVNNFSKLNVIFGSIGTIMLLMIWLNINAFVLLIGYELNASIHYNKLHRFVEIENKKHDDDD
ncbi:MAG TPA: YihY/virulence factor BrkB family protein [Chitinophagales bacterium]|nr:YihY/virulence factor BrkB family protein [Chitinophagales bacterium]